MSLVSLCCGAVASVVGVVTLTLPTLPAEERSEGRPPAARISDSPDDPVRQVVAISVDGLRPGAIRELGSAGAPALHRMMRQGVSTLNARTVLESTSTLPNHASMLTGRRVDPPQGHGLRVNSDLGGTVHDGTGRYVASMFDVVHDHGGRTGLYSMKDKFELFDRSWNARNGARDRDGVDHGRDKVDRFVLGSAKKVTRRVVGRLRSTPDRLSFLHLANPDAAGHENGFASSAYLRAVRRVDRQVARVLRAVRSSPSLRRHTTVVLTADHGGRASDHGDQTARANYTVPFIVWGASVSPGRSLYALNPDRDNPRNGRPGYAGSQPVRNGDVANLVTDLLDLPRVPGSEFNRPADLDVHAPAGP